MKNFFKISIASIIAIFFLLTSLNVTLATENLEIGEGVYRFEEKSGANKDPIDVLYYRPKNWQNGDKI